MDSNRQKKVARVIQKALGDLFQKHGSTYFGRAFVTVTEVRMTPDLATAHTHLSVYNVEKPEQVIDQIDHEKGDIRRRLGQVVRNQLRVVPELRFHLDTTLDKVFRIEGLLKESKGEQPD